MEPLVMFCVGAIVAIGAYVAYISIFRKNKETMIAEFFNALPYMEHVHNMPRLNNHPHTSLNPYSQYALWIVPGVQPKIHTPVDKYGGYHITLLPTQPMKLPENYSLDEVLLKFPSDVNRRWNLNLPNISVEVKHTKSHLAVMVISGAGTLNLLRKFFESNIGGGWKPLHANNTMDASTNSTIDNFNMMTLGSDDPYEQTSPNAFTYQTTWYVQLVKVTGSKYQHIPHQRVMLYVAENLQG